MPFKNVPVRIESRPGRDLLASGATDAKGNFFVKIIPPGVYVVVSPPIGSGYIAVAVPVDGKDLRKLKGTIKVALEKDI